MVGSACLSIACSQNIISGYAVWKIPSGCTHFICGGGGGGGGGIPLSFIPGTASFMVWNAAVRLIAMIWSHLSAEYCSKGATCQIPSGNRGREGRREGREKRRKGEAEGGEEEDGRKGGGGGKCFCRIDILRMIDHGINVAARHYHLSSQTLLFSWVGPWPIHAPICSPLLPMYTS